MLAQGAGVEGTAEPVALPAPTRKPRRKRGADASPLLPQAEPEGK
jgi:hypothetical protein